LNCTTAVQRIGHSRPRKKQSSNVRRLCWKAFDGVGERLWPHLRNRTNSRRAGGVRDMRILGAAAAVSVVSLCLTGSSLHAKDKTPASITVAFGAGLNTALPGNTPNHHIIPQDF